MLKSSQHIKNNISFKNLLLKNIVAVFDLKYLALPFIMLITNIYSQRIYECKKLELIPLQDIYDKTMQLENNSIVKAHNLNSNSEHFIQYIEQHIDNEKAKIVDIRVGEPNKLLDIQIVPIEIQSVFIHDKFIFDFIDKINQYAGFVRTVAVKINKKSLNDGRHVLETTIVCTLYTK